MKLLICALGGLALVACQLVGTRPAVGAPGASASAPASAPAGGDALTQQRVGLQAQLRALIGDAACSHDAQCRTLPVGARACGGPAAWWAWSAQQTDGEPLRHLAQRLHALDREHQRRSGLLSTCAVLPDPGAACVAGRCTLQVRDAAR